MKTMKKIFAAILVFAVVLSMTAYTTAFAAKSDKITLTVAVGAYTEASPRGQLYAALKSELEEAFGDRFVWNMLTPGSIGGDKDMVQACLMGDVDFINIGDASFDIVLGNLGWAFMPMMFANYEEVDANYYNGWIGEEITNTLAEAGLVRVGYFEAGFRVAANKVREVTSIEDFKGIKLRVPELPYITEFYQNIGVLPVALPNTEVVTGIQQGTIDGQDNYLTAMDNMGSLEMTKYITDMNYTYCGNSLVVSQKFWDSLTPEDQELFASVVSRVGKEMTQVARDDEMRIRNDYVADGTLVITEPSPEFRAQLKEAAVKVWESQAPKYDSAIMDRIFADFGID